VTALQTWPAGNALDGDRVEGTLLLIGHLLEACFISDMSFCVLFSLSSLGDYENTYLV
jgi:hypothetical protein